MLEGVKKHYSGSDVSGCVKERQGAGGLVGRGTVFLGGVGWMDSAGTKGEVLGAGRGYPDQGAEGVASTGDGTYMQGLVVHKEDTRRGNEVCQSLIVHGHGEHATHIVSVRRRGREICGGRWPRVGGMRRSRQSWTRHPRLNSRRGGGV